MRARLEKARRSGAACPRFVMMGFGLDPSCTGWFRIFAIYAPQYLQTKEAAKPRRPPRMVDAKWSVFEPQAGAKPIHISTSRTMLESALHALGVGFVVGQVSARCRKSWPISGIASFGRAGGRLSPVGIGGCHRYESDGQTCNQEQRGFHGYFLSQTFMTASSQTI